MKPLPCAGVLAVVRTYALRMDLRAKVRGMRWIGGPAFASVGRRIIPAADLAVQRLSRGHASLSGAGGIPLLVLITVGRRTGTEYRTPLLYVEDGADLIVIGSNWGQAHHPQWALNLRAAGKAEVEVDGRRGAVRAEVLEGAERDAVWPLLLKPWPHFDRYTERAGGRQLLVFRLTYVL